MAESVKNSVDDIMTEIGGFQERLRNRREFMSVLIDALVSCDLQKTLYIILTPLFI